MVKYNKMSDLWILKEVISSKFNRTGSQKCTNPFDLGTANTSEETLGAVPHDYHFLNDLFTEFKCRIKFIKIIESCFHEVITFTEFRFSIRFE